MKFSLKTINCSLNTHFEWEKLSFDDFLMTTWEPEVDSQRKKKPKIPRPSDQICSSLGATHLARQFQYAVCYIMEQILELSLKYCGLFFGLEFEFYWICYVT